MGIRFEKRVVNIIEGVINSTLVVNQKKLIIKKIGKKFSVAPNGGTALVL